MGSDTDEVSVMMDLEKEWNLVNKCVDVLKEISKDSGLASYNKDLAEKVLKELMDNRAQTSEGLNFKDRLFAENLHLKSQIAMLEETNKSLESNCPYPFCPDCNCEVRTCDSEGLCLSCGSDPLWPTSEHAEMFYAITETDRLIPEFSDRVVKVLRDALRRDPVAISSLMKSKIVTNASLADHPAIQCGKRGDKFTIGPLGLINGILGIDEYGWGPIAGVVEIVCPAHGQLEKLKGLAVGDDCPEDDCAEILCLGNFEDFVRVGHSW